MKHALPRLTSVALPASVLLSLGLAHAQSSVQLTPPPMFPSRTPVAATPAAGAGTASAIATCLPAIRDQSGGGCIQASSVPTYGDLLPLSDYFNVTPAAQVGIGTASPAGTLHVKQAGGSAHVILDSTVDCGLRYFSSGVPIWDVSGNPTNYDISRSGIDTPFQINYATGQILLNQSGGQVGIGTSTVDANMELQVSRVGSTADMLLSGTGGGAQHFEDSGTYAWDIYGNLTSYAIVRSGIDVPFQIDYGTGYLGLGTTSPTQRLDVAGNVRCVSLIQTSAREFKKDIAPLTGALDSILKLQGVTYSWNDKAPEAVQGHADIGFIADDVDAVLPEIVSKDESGKVLGLDYGKITPVAVEAIKELNAKNLALEARLAKLEALLAGQTK